MQLSKRLQAVAELVTPGMRVADVGCDHAYTSIYLAENKISPQIIAMDINRGPIERAKENIVKFGYSDKIEARQSNGVIKLETGETDTILIAGMGGALITQILLARIDILSEIKELILQPQSEIYKVRQMLQEQNFLIIKENMIWEDDKYYTMMKAVPRSMIKQENDYLLTEKEHFYYGRLLLEQRHPVLSEFLYWDLSLCEGILKVLETEKAGKSEEYRKIEEIDKSERSDQTYNANQTEKTEKVIRREEEIRERVLLIQNGLKYYNKVQGS